MRVLVVEDEVLIAVALEESLQDFGHEVIGPYKRVREALDAARNEALDAAVLDVNLRDEVVFPVADALKARGVPFVFCTGYAEMQLIPEAFSAFPCLSKPCAPEKVLAALQAVSTPELRRASAY
ncbi:MAG: response regulator [Proteobacteria bacterium]|nr:response regulator [Pseudomonadota bacterium]